MPSSRFLCFSSGSVLVSNEIEFSDLLAVGWLDFSTVLGGGGMICYWKCVW